MTAEDRLKYFTTIQMTGLDLAFGASWDSKCTSKCAASPRIMVPTISKLMEREQPDAFLAVLGVYVRQPERTPRNLVKLFVTLQSCFLFKSVVTIDTT
jgi:hypothetical protein